METRRGLLAVAALGIGAFAQPASGWGNKFVFFFGFESDLLTSTAWSTVRQIIQTVRGDRRLVVSISGHADTAEADGAALSLRRATVARSAIVGSGIDEARVLVFGEGSTRLLVPTPPDHREAQNRRVEVVLL